MKPKSAAKSVPPDQPVIRQPGQSSFRVVLAVVMIVLAVSAGIWYAITPPFITPPDPDLASVPPSLASALGAARKEILTANRSDQAWGRFGMLLMAHQYETEASLCLQQAATLAPQEFRWPYLLALNVSVVDPQAAEKWYRVALHADRPQPVVHTRLAELLFAQGRWEAALPEYEAALKARPDDIRALIGRARIAGRQGQTDAAIADAMRALTLAPQVATLHEFLAQQLQTAGRVAEARQELEFSRRCETSEVPWDDPVAGEVMGLRRDGAWAVRQADELVQRRQVDEAIQRLKSSLTEDDRDPQVWIALAKLLARTGQGKAATELLVQARKRFPGAAEIPFQQGVLSFSARRYEAARDEFAAATVLKPDHAFAHFNLGQAEDKLGHVDEAITATNQAIELRPDMIEPYMAVGKMLLACNRSEEAVQRLSVARRLAPQNEAVRQLWERAQRQQTGRAP